MRLVLRGIRNMSTGYCGSYDILESCTTEIFLFAFTHISDQLELLLDEDSLMEILIRNQD